MAVTKSPTAYRTISEVADLLGVEAHVLRYWETQFGQVKPVKRKGGRRHYRPQDIAVLRQIQALLHDQGFTIRGAREKLREKTAKTKPLIAALPMTGAEEVLARAKSEAQGAAQPAVSAPMAQGASPSAQTIDTFAQKKAMQMQLAALHKELCDLKTLSQSVNR